MLVKVLFNKIPIKCFINIYYSLVAVVGNMHLPRRARMKCSKVLFAGEGEKTILWLFVFTAWCVSADTDPACEWRGSLFSKFPSQDLV